MTTSSGKIRPSARLGGHEGRLIGDYAEEEITYFHQPFIEKMRYTFDPIMHYNFAHVVMLTEQGILDRERSRTLLAGLREVEELGADGIDLDPKLEGVYLNVESLVIDKIGYNVGGMLYLGRTRGDAQRVPDRMAQRASMLDVMAEVIEIRKATLQLASQHAETLMPGYTHLQHAQPMTFGFYLLWFADALETDVDRLVDAYKRLNMSPAEIGAGMTTGFPVSRERVAELLGFEGLIENALYAHRSLDREVEHVGALSLLAQDIYRLCEDFLVWCSSDVKLLELDDRYSATSFMMPQKKNPVGLHHVEAAALTAHGAYVVVHDIGMRNTSEVTLKGSQAITSCREAIDSVFGATKLIKGIISSVVVHQDAMREHVGRSFAQATELADMLVREAGVSFREAHRIVGTLVRHAAERSMAPSDITPRLLSMAAEEAIGKPVILSEESLRRALDPMEGVRARTVVGGTAPEAVRQAIERKRAAVDAHERWLAQKRQLLQDAEQKLQAACATMLSN